MTDVNNNPVLSKPWPVGLFSIDYSPILKLTDKQETQKLTSAFNRN